MPGLLKTAAAHSVSSAFAGFADFVVTGSYWRDGEELAAVSFIALPVTAAMADGVAVLPNDERLLIAAADLAGVDRPRPGDQVRETSNAQLRNVVAAHLDVSGAVWRLIARRVF